MSTDYRVCWGDIGFVGGEITSYWGSTGGGAGGGVPAALFSPVVEHNVSETS